MDQVSLVPRLYCPAFFSHNHSKISGAKKSWEVEPGNEARIRYRYSTDLVVEQRAY